MTPTPPLFRDRIATPIGEMVLIADRDNVLRMLEFADKPERWEPAFARRFGAAAMAERRTPLARTLARYFKGDLAALDEIETDGGGTPFQRAQWSALRKIPAGETTTYAALAKKLRKPAAFRAVGLANGANPIAVVVPCHRVLGSDGSLTGYGGGLDRKRWLLDHERRHA